MAKSILSEKALNRSKTIREFRQETLSKATDARAAEILAYIIYLRHLDSFRERLVEVIQ